MKTRLLTVTSVVPDAIGTRLSPGLHRADWEQNASTRRMMQGSELELREPNGIVRPALLKTYGISAWKQADGSLAVYGDLNDPEIHLTITSEPAEVPAGTEVWLVDDSEE